MKAVYWEPRKVSRTALVLVCAMALGGVALSELSQRYVISNQATEEKLAASTLAAEAMQCLREERLRRGHVFDPAFDPALSGMIGEYLTPITSVSGHLASKQTSVNPNFAAAIVEMLREAGVKQGDLVAVGCSGSFPALNVCTAAALETLQAKPIVVASAAASQFGANRPDFLWIDQERLLYERGLISFRSVASSLGGYEDQAAGASEEGQRLLREGIERNQLPLLADDDFGGSIDDRMRLYEQQAAGRPIKAYVNVGGGTISVGRSVGKKLYEPGLNLTATPEALAIDSVMTRFAKQDVPLIHLVEITEIAHAYQLPIAPTETPSVGEGRVFYETRYHRWLAGGVLLALSVVLAKLSRRTAVEEPAIVPLSEVEKPRPKLAA